MITYQQESVVTVINDVTDLARFDWDEISHDKDAYPFDPNWDLYKSLEDNNALFIFTARDKGKLVGYFSVVKTPSLHSRGKFIFCNDVIYLHREHRRGFVGVKLFRFVESCLRDDGCTNLQVVFTDKYDITPLLLRLDYSHIETKFEKRLG